MTKNVFSFKLGKKRCFKFHFKLYFVPLMFFSIAFLNYGGFWSSLRLCPGIKHVEVARDETKLIEDGYYVFRVVTDHKGIKIPAFQYDIFKPLIDNGWSYDRTRSNDTVEIFTCLGDDCYNKHLTPPDTNQELVYIINNK